MQGSRPIPISLPDIRDQCKLIRNSFLATPHNTVEANAPLLRPSSIHRVSAMPCPNTNSPCLKRAHIYSRTFRSLFLFVENRILSGAQVALQSAHELYARNTITGHVPLFERDTGSRTTSRSIFDVSEGHCIHQIVGTLTQYQLLCLRAVISAIHAT